MPWGLGWEGAKAVGDSLYRHAGPLAYGAVRNLVGTGAAAAGGLLARRYLGYSRRRPRFGRARRYARAVRRAPVKRTRTRQNFRRRFKRRRFMKGRARRGKNGFRNAILKAICPPRMMVMEDSETLTVIQGKQAYWLPAVIDHPVELETVMADTGNQDGVLLGGTVGPNKMQWIGPVKLSMRLTNPNGYMIYVTVYFISCRRDFTDILNTEDTQPSAITVNTAAMRRLNDGWNDMMAGGDEDVTFPNATTTGNHLQTKNQALTPYESARFTRDWKIVKSISKMVKPGECMSWSFGSRAMGYVSEDRWFMDERNLGIRRFTKGCLIRVRMAMGHEALFPTVEETMGGLVHVDWIKRYSIKHVDPHARNMSYINSRNAGTANPLELITEYTAEATSEA